MTVPDIKTLLQPIQNRVDDAETKRARSRANPDPIWDASMILAIQASSADVPKLLAAVQALAEVHEPDIAAGPDGEGITDYCPACSTYWPCPTVAAVVAALHG